MVAKPTFRVLDAIRGMAAFCVVLYHYAPFLVVGSILPSGNLAVDLFFGLSGFVIAYAYDDRLAKGLNWREFALVRLIRLYPLYLAGSLIGFGFVLIRNFTEPARHVGGVELAGTLVKTMLFIPDLGRHGFLSGTFPFDQAAWSLSFEMAVNLIYAILFRYLTPRRLALIVALSGAGLIYYGLRQGKLDIGMIPGTFGGGAARAMFSFFMGVLLFRVRDARVVRGGWWGAVVLGIILLLFVDVPHGQARVWWELGAILVAFPTLIYVGSQCPRIPVIGSLFDRAALLSYAVYIIHVPLSQVMTYACRWLTHQAPEAVRPISGIVFIVATLATAQAAVTWYDEPVRRWLAGLRRRAKEGRGAAPNPARDQVPGPYL